MLLLRSCALASFLLAGPAVAFSRTRRVGFLTPKKNHASRAKTHESTSTSLRATQKLVFKGDYTATSDKLPEGTTKNDVSKFLAQPENQRVFLSAGLTRETRPLEMTPQFKEYWEDVAEHFNSDSRPADDDAVIAVDVQVKFPGMKLVTTTVSGIKQLALGDESMELMLIAEKSEAMGAAPVVWLFNKLTGNDKKEQGVFLPPEMTKVRSFIGQTDLGNGALALRYKLQMQVTVEFPAVLMKILPTSIEKMEEQGSKSILKTVSKDIDTAMKVAHEKFVEQSTMIESS